MHTSVHRLLYIFLSFFIIGCNNVEQRFDPYKLKTTQSNKEIELKKLETDSKIELAKINAQKEEKIKQIEAKSRVDVANIQKEISIKEQDVILKSQDEKNKLYQKIAILFAIIIVIGLIVYAYIHKKNRELKLKIKQEELKKERDLHKEACYNDRINKMLEIVASNDTDQKIKNQLVEMLKEEKRQDIMIEHKQ